MAITMNYPFDAMEYTFNDRLVCQNPKEVYRYTSSDRRVHASVYIAEYNGRYINGYDLICIESGTSMPCMYSSMIDDYDTEQQAINNGFDRLISSVKSDIEWYTNSREPNQVKRLQAILDDIRQHQFGCRQMSIFDLPNV